MALALGDVQLLVQQTVSDGVVTIVGSGLSAAAGLPTMAELADLLLDEMPGDSELAAHWEPLAEKLKTTDLESAMEGVAADNPALSRIVELVAGAVAAKEREVLTRMARGERLPFTVLVDRLQRVDERILVVTTNYDRLIEACVEHAGLPIDTSFTGSYFGRFDPPTSRQMFQSLPRQRLRRVTTTTRPHVAVFKPHGSLDWFSVNGDPVRSMLDIEAQRLIITPGSSKFELGYERPFDHHRAAGNDAIDKARSLLLVGYGFNDSHLQTHLAPALNRGTPAVVIAHTLTVAAHAQLAAAPHVLALEATPGGEVSTTAHYRGERVVLKGVDLWNLGSLIEEALS